MRDANPIVNVDHLSPDARAIARIVHAPEHAWVKEFLRAYLGAHFATRALIREVAPRIIEPDALIGTTLELVRTASQRIHPSDALYLIAATPIIPGPIAQEKPLFLARFGEEILANYGNTTCVRILESLIHTVAQEYARVLEPRFHTPNSLRYALRVRNENVTDAVTQWSDGPIPPAMAPPLAELLPELVNGATRDQQFAAALIGNPLVTRLVPTPELEAMWHRLTISGHEDVSVTLLESADNPDLGHRLGMHVHPWVYARLRVGNERIRAAAIRALAAADIRNVNPRAAWQVLRGALRSNDVPLAEAAIDVVNDAGFAVLGTQGEALFTQRLGLWIRSRRHATGSAQLLLYVAESHELRDRLPEPVRWSVLNRLAYDRDPEVRERAGEVIDFVLRGGDSTPWPAHQTQPATRNLGVLARALDIIVNRDDIALPPSQTVRSWRDLDPDFDVPFPLADIADLLDGKIIRGARPLHINVLRTARALEANAQAMRNCTRNWRPELEAGDTILIALTDTDGKTRYNADWYFEDGFWQFKGCLGRSNETHVPVPVLDALQRLTVRLNQPRRERVERTEPQYGR